MVEYARQYLYLQMCGVGGDCVDGIFYSRCGFEPQWISDRIKGIKCQEEDSGQAVLPHPVENVRFQHGSSVSPTQILSTVS